MCAVDVLCPQQCTVLYLLHETVNLLFQKVRLCDELDANCLILAVDSFLPRNSLRQHSKSLPRRLQETKAKLYKVSTYLVQSNPIVGQVV